MSSVEIERPKPAVAVLRLDRPERLNAISWGLVEELHGALDALDRDNACRIVVLTGAGRAFCAGLDLHVTPRGRSASILGAAARAGRAGGLTMSLSHGAAV